jgi:hypothetical protein
MGVPKSPTLRLLQLWILITLCADLQLQWGINKKCSPGQTLSNGMLHVTWTQGNLVDSRLLVIGSQIANLTPDSSFGHILCFRCPNESCEPILDIYVSIAFQWYKKLFNAMGFDPWNCALKIQKSTRTPTPKVGVPLGVWGSIPSLSCPPRLPSWPVTLQPPCFGRKPKARVSTHNFSLEVSY